MNQMSHSTAVQFLSALEEEEKKVRVGEKMQISSILMCPSVEHLFPDCSYLSRGSSILYFYQFQSLAVTNTGELS